LCFFFLLLTSSGCHSQNPLSNGSGIEALFISDSVYWEYFNTISNLNKFGSIRFLRMFLKFHAHQSCICLIKTQCEISIIVKYLQFANSCFQQSCFSHMILQKSSCCFGAKHFLLLSMLKTVVLLNSFFFMWKLSHFFHNYLMKVTKNSIYLK